MLCAGFLFLLGKSLGLSYKQISVIFNLYLQGGILFVSGMMPLAAITWRLIEQDNNNGLFLLLMSLSYATIYVVAFIRLIQHYHLPMDYSFDLCVRDLQAISRKWNISYHAVNLVIFIWWWLSLVGINCYLTYTFLN
jgi:hypothetical protein